MMEREAPVGDIFAAAREAGHQLVRNGEMSTETLDIVSRELVPLETYVKLVNQGFRRTLEALEEK